MAANHQEDRPKPHAVAAVAKVPPSCGVSQTTTGATRSSGITLHIMYFSGSYGAFLENHIEVQRLVGISIPCNNCDQAFGFRVSLRKHKSLTCKALGGSFMFVD